MKSTQSFIPNFFISYRRNLVLETRNCVCALPLLISISKKLKCVETFAFIFSNPSFLSLCKTHAKKITWYNSDKGTSFDFCCHSTCMEVRSTQINYANSSCVSWTNLIDFECVCERLETILLITTNEK